MLTGTFVTLGLACLFGLLLICFADWRLIWVGIAIAICVLAYSAGPFPLAYNGLGDVCVLLFYGVIPVCFTYYVQTLSFSLLSFLLSVALGLLSVNILVVNNYRDYEQDKAARKRTTIVLFGRRFGRVFYILNECIAFILVLPLILDAPLVDSVFIRNPVRPLLLYDTGTVRAGRKSLEPHIGTYRTQCIPFCGNSFPFIRIYWIWPVIGLP